MNLILLTEEDFAEDGTALLRGRRARHICEIHRARPGDVLKAGLWGGPLGPATVLGASPEEVSLAVRWEDCPPPGLAIDVILALPRPKVLHRVVSALTSMGVKRLVLVNSRRVEKCYWGATLLKEEELQNAVALGLEQACDTIPPVLLMRQRLRPFLENELGKLWPEGCLRLLAHPEAKGALESVGKIAPGQRVVVAIGPEGGWIPFETDLFEEQGFSSFTLGPRILRVATVLPYLLGQIELLRRLPK